MRLKELRQIKGLTQSQLADKLGCNQTAIGKYERGDLQPRIETLFKLANIFDCSIDYLLGYEKDAEYSYANTNPSDKEKRILELFGQLPEDGQQTIIDTMRFMVKTKNIGQGEKCV